MPYRLGAFLNLLRFEPHTWEADLRRLDELGCDHLELWLEFEPTRDQVRTLAELLDGREAIMHGPFVNLSLASACDEIASASASRCSRAIEVAGYLGCKVVTLHAGKHLFVEDRREVLGRVADRFARFASIASPVVTLENMRGRPGASEDALGSLADMALLAEVLPESSLTLDVGHALHDDGIDGVVAFLREHHARVHDIHLHDATPGGRSHLALGQGGLDLPMLLCVLDEVGYDRYLTLETLGFEDTASSWARVRETERELAAPPLDRAA